MLEVSYQQIQKYETARNRVSASRLYQLAQMLEVPITWFYDGLEVDPAETGRASNLSQTVDREVLQFVGMYCRIRNAGARSRLRELTSVLAGRK
jgi:transcriptional regulator with XRE-family HTH domain